MRRDPVSIAVIGGSGLYALEGMEGVSSIEVDTPFGRPSGPIVKGRLAGANLFFLARHGPGHTLLPSEINYRANIYALKSLGVSWCISVSAVGSLTEKMRPGEIVIPDQLIDKTFKRESSFFGDGVVAHVSFGQPFCDTLRSILCAAANEVAQAEKCTVHTSGTYVCMEGPAFSSKAESLLHRSWGAHLIGMTNLPEAKLAREAELAYGTIALVTDYDSWKDDEEHVDVSKVLQILKRNGDNAKKIVAAAARSIEAQQPMSSAFHALQNALMTDFNKTPPATLERLKLLIGPYLKK